MDQQLNIRTELEYGLFNNLRHGQYILGTEVFELEKQLARFIGVKHCISVGSGTDALLLSLLAADVSALDEVITSPFNFIAAAQMIAFIGAKPVFVDIDPETYNLDVNLLEAAITPQTRAIIPANLYGQCADYDSINAIAQTYRLMVIEDATQSFGARYKNRWSGSLTQMSCTGFTPSKPLGAYGDAGACFTNDDLLADKLRRLRVHGQKERYHHELIGINSRLDTIQANVLLAKLKIFPKEITARMEVGNRYTESLQNKVKTPVIQSYNQSCYSQYTIEVDERDLVRDKLAKRGIPTAVNYPLPLHLQPALSYLIQDKGSLPIAEAASKRVLSLPMDAYLTPEMQQEIIDAVKNAVK
ncbi:aminotransferase DegT [Thioflexithrix psekupsensis]|uniref:Aminotransferase DegT n=1 Tax=Thioflexithrix psekupsensis TaxID=1570016 RepID=A0A251X5H4_9GAMM|nr:aminotransferase DegT [Thioflexithrix psekupsensis]